jgi:UDP-N-acetylglucosamine--N-acetylmuramyl-(pentapeptide) pyrophosphoryl-undecaprenol N-acetylglucosamine transferase
MNLVYAAADVAVCRAGASTVAELAAAGLPAVLIPLPGAPGDHQTANARALVDAGAARIIPDQELTAARLADELDDVLADPATLARMSVAARSVARPDAAARVARLAEEHARGAA